MRNAKEEFLTHTNGKQIKCAVLDFDSDHIVKEFTLNLNYNKIDFEHFLFQLDFCYDNGYGFQELYGTIWYIDGTWSERAEYDGSEWWVHHSCPEIPEQLKG